MDTCKDSFSKFQTDYTAAEVLCVQIEIASLFAIVHFII